MKRRSILSKTEIMIFLLMFPIIKPNSIREIAPLAEKLFDVGRLISVILIFLIFSSTLRRRPDIRSSLWILVLLEVLVVLVTAFNNPDRFFASIINGCAVIAVLMLVETFAKSAPEALLKALMANFEWVIYVNLFTQIAYPEGLYQYREHPCFFLGLNNSAVIYILPGVIIAYLYYVCLGRKLRPLFLVVASAISIIIGWCATSVVGLLTSTAVFIFLNAKRTREKLKLIHIWIISIVFDLLISFIRIMDTFPPLKYFIEIFLGKSTTLSGRTYIWDEALLYWAGSPLFGNGYDTWLPFETSYVNHAHNAYIQYLLIGGIIGLILFLAFILFCISNFDANCGASKSGKGIKTAFSVLFVTYITEACNYPLLFILYALADCIPVFVTLEYGKRIQSHAE